MRSTLILLAASLSLLACDPEPCPPAIAGGVGAAPELPAHLQEEIGETVATVNGMPVGINEYSQLAGRRLRAATSDELSDEERMEVLQELIDQKALYLVARERGLDRDPRVQRLMVQILLQGEVYGDIKSADLTDAELRDYYERNRESFIIPEQARLRRIFIKAEPTRSAAEAEALVAGIYERVKANPDRFAKIAAETSEGPYRGRGGDLGLVGHEPRAGVPPEVVERGFAMPVGGVSEPFFVSGGYNIVMVADRRERIERTFEQMRGAVVRRAKSEKHQQAYQDYVASKREGLDIQTFPDRLGRLSVQEPIRGGSLPFDPGAERGGAEGSPE